MERFGHRFKDHPTQRSQRGRRVVRLIGWFNHLTDDGIEESFTLRPMERIERASELKIGAFNIQVFGASKSRKDDVMERLVDILTRYDIVLIQEIRDSSGRAILSLLGQLNAENQGGLSNQRESTSREHRYERTIRVLLQSF